MTAYEIFKCLSLGYGQWAAESRRVRWAAARYYAGVDSLDDLRAMATRRPFRGDQLDWPILSNEQVAMIRDLR